MHLRQTAPPEIPCETETCSAFEPPALLQEPSWLIVACSPSCLLWMFHSQWAGLFFCPVVSCYKQPCGKVDAYSSVLIAVCFRNKSELLGQECTTGFFTLLALLYCTFWCLLHEVEGAWLEFRVLLWCCMLQAWCYWLPAIAFHTLLTLHELLCQMGIIAKYCSLCLVSQDLDETEGRLEKEGMA